MDSDGLVISGALTAVLEDSGKCAFAHCGIFQTVCCVVSPDDRLLFPSLLVLKFEFLPPSLLRLELFDLLYFQHAICEGKSKEQARVVVYQPSVLLASTSKVRE